MNNVIFISNYIIFSANGTNNIAYELIFRSTDPDLAKQVVKKNIENAKLLSQIEEMVMSSMIPKLQKTISEKMDPEVESLRKQVESLESSKKNILNQLKETREELAKTKEQIKNFSGDNTNTLPHGNCLESEAFIKKLEEKERETVEKINPELNQIKEEIITMKNDRKQSLRCRFDEENKGVLSYCKLWVDALQKEMKVVKNHNKALLKTVEELKKKNEDADKVNAAVESLKFENGLLKSEMETLKNMVGKIVIDFKCFKDHTYGFKNDDATINDGNVTLTSFISSTVPNLANKENVASTSTLDQPGTSKATATDDSLLDSNGKSLKLERLSQSPTKPFKSPQKRKRSGVARKKFSDEERQIIFAATDESGFCRGEALENLLRESGFERKKVIDYLHNVRAKKARLIKTMNGGNAHVS